VVKHAIDYLESTGKVFDVVILLQPTSPLRSSKDIDSKEDLINIEHIVKNEQGVFE
jgi:CMP-N-acetylneuraminic acid synthetase